MPEKVAELSAVLDAQLERNGAGFRSKIRTTILRLSESPSESLLLNGERSVWTDPNAQFK